MMRLKLVPSETKITLMAARALVLSAMLVLASLGVFLISGLNLGIDFKGGILLGRAVPRPADVWSAWRS